MNEENVKYCPTCGYPWNTVFCESCDEQETSQDDDWDMTP